MASEETRVGTELAKQVIEQEGYWMRSEDEQNRVFERQAGDPMITLPRTGYLPQSQVDELAKLFDISANHEGFQVKRDADRDEAVKQVQKDNWE